MSKNKKSNISAGLIVRILISVLWIGLIIWKFDFLSHIDVTKYIDTDHLGTTVLTLLGIYGVKGATLVVPASLVYIAIGIAMPKTIIFGVEAPLIALGVNTAGIIIEVTVTYLMGMVLGGSFVTKKLKATKYGDKMFGIYDKHEKSAVFIMRITGLPIDFCSLFFGAMKTSYTRFLVMSLAGLLPRVILFTIFGYAVKDLIPMDKVIPAAVILVAALLIFSTVKYAVKSKGVKELKGDSPYVPLCRDNRSVILDTDISTACDDAGAIAVMIEYLRKYGNRLLGICNCTSDPWGCGAIRAICSRYRMEDVLIGINNFKELDPDNSKYTKKVTKKYFEHPHSACEAVDAIDFYKKLLSGAEDDSVTIISIGMFTNLAAVIERYPELFNSKVHSVIAMAGKYPKGKEFNITEDPESASFFFEKYRGLMIFSDFNLAYDIRTGFDEPQEGNPVYDCFALHYGGKLPYLCRSFDLTAVHYAFEGESIYYGLTKPVSITVEANGNMKVKGDRYSQKYFMTKKADDEEIAYYLNEILLGRPKWADGSFLPVNNADPEDAD